MSDGVMGLFARLGRKDKTSDTGTHKVGSAPVAGERVRIVNPYHAVSIHSGSHGCITAQALVGIRFLSREAPRLPLKDCNSPNCQCRYVHHDDRRARLRRTADGRDDGGAAKPYAGPERRLRSSSGRRDTD